MAVFGSFGFKKLVDFPFATMKSKLFCYWSNMKLAANASTHLKDMGIEQITLVLIAIHGKHVLQKNIKEMHYTPKEVQVLCLGIF